MKKYQIWEENRTKSQFHKHKLLKTLDNEKEFEKEIKNKEIKDSGESYFFKWVII